jgi:outer membrane immunogenic protein
MPRFLLTLGCGAILLAGGMSIAAAADLPPPVYVPAAQVFSWTGFYIGANAGYGWSNASGTLTTTTGSEPFNFTGNGFVGGAQMGYNWQAGPAVFGAEADFQGTTISGPFTASAGPAISATDKGPWFGTVRARVGYAMDRFMVYATGGGVYGDISMSGTVTPSGSFSSSTTFWTWTAGVGAEMAFWGCWSGKLEYRYIGTPNRSPAIPTVTALSGTVSSNIVRAGINYHF